jgi:ribose 5-phosphate isomerase B
MKVYIGADHNGYHMRKALLEHLKKSGYDTEDDGDQQLNPEDDYPIFAAKVVSGIKASNDHDARGILICGSGQGMCMAANRFKGIRAALGYDKESVRTSRNDDDANVLCLPARVLAGDKANELVELFLQTPFAGAPRFKRRIKEIDELS